MRIHLDLLGGLAGDMFIAALLDAFPEHVDGVLASIGLGSGPAVACRLVSHGDGVLQGKRFEVAVPPSSHEHTHTHTHTHTHDHRHDHEHVPWRRIRERLQASPLDPGVLRHAIGIFEALAEAEGRVHGVDPAEVAFHEVGAWDSIADIVGAAHLVDALGDVRWSVGPVPLGSGRVKSAHGPLPVPAPATAVLLEGFAVLDDGVAGERVTPTGASILRYLCGDAAMQSAAAPRPERLRGSGIGFGTKRLAGISNCVRALVLDDAAVEPSAYGSHRQLAVIEFEVDDQSAEDLAMGLEHLRAHPAVFDVIQSPAFGKKGRMTTAVRALASPARIDEAMEACFRETSTIGLRHHLVQGAALARTQREVAVGGATVRVKIVERPGGATAKAESDDVRARGGHAHRRALRMEAEHLALQAEADAREGAAKQPS